MEVSTRRTQDVRKSKRTGKGKSSSVTRSKVSRHWICCWLLKLLVKRGGTSTLKVRKEQRRWKRPQAVLVKGQNHQGQSSHKSFQRSYRNRTMRSGERLPTCRLRHPPGRRKSSNGPRIQWLYCEAARPQPLLSYTATYGLGDVLVN